MRFLERVFVRVDQPPWAELLRITVGYLVVPTWSASTRGQSSGWTLFPFFLVILAALRLVPLVLRKLLPLDGSVQAILAERRQLAKRVDSYQWQKVFWLGIGLALYTLQSGERFGALLTLTFVCLLSGALGLVIWRQRRAAQGS